MPLYKITFNFLWLSLVAFSCNAQVTIILDEIPKNTPKKAKIFIAGNFNTWSPNDSRYLLQKSQTGKYQITFTPNTENIEFKCTLGSWEKVEVNTDNQDITNRKFNSKSQKEIHIKILAWKKNSKKLSTASSNVKIVSKNFEIPQLKRKRRIWIYLPPGYENSTKKYPVLYAHDGQNLFDAATAYGEEWKLDESLDNLLANQQNPEIIVIGIDNGEKHRMHEYSPWKHPKYSQGEGEAYVEFIVKNLKPFIDKKYRTLSDRENTGIMGSSMGGLISFYAALKHPEVFDKAAVLSPSFWISEKVFEMAQNFESKYQPKFYFLAGGKEGIIMTAPLKSMYELFQEKKYPDAKMVYSLIPEGEHKEWFWHQEFPKVYSFLFK